MKKDLLKALRNGTTPQAGFSEIIVGVDEIRDQIHEQFDYVSDGKCDGKFIAGAYGSGKTFLCRTLFEDAIEKNFVASEVVISPDIQLNHLKDVYTELVHGFRTADNREGSALQDIVEKWLHKLQQKVQSMTQDQNLSREEIGQRLEQKIEDELDSLKNFNTSIANVIRTFMKARLNQNRELASDAIAWLKGDENLAYQKKKSIGVRGDLEADQVFQALESLLHVIRKAGYNGLFIILDEIETVQRLHTRNQRKNAYETLRKIVDKFGTDELPGAFFLGTGTEELFDENNKKGVASYKALRDRLVSTDDIKSDTSNSRQLIYTLRGLTKDDLTEVAQKVRSLHGDVYEWSPESDITDRFVQDFTEDYVTSFGEEYSKLPRQFLKTFVQLLDHVEDGADPEDVLAE
jgi:hypothetical protein